MSFLEKIMAAKREEIAVARNLKPQAELEKLAAAREDFRGFGFPTAEMRRGAAQADGRRQANGEPAGAPPCRNRGTCASRPISRVL